MSIPNMVADKEKMKNGMIGLQCLIDVIQAHPIRIVDRQNPSAMEPPFQNECILIRWTGSGGDI